MDEAQIRAIVRDEIEAEALKVGGIYDHVRQVAFNMMRGLFETQAKQTLASFDSDKTGGLQ